MALFALECSSYKFRNTGFSGMSGPDTSSMFVICYIMIFFQSTYYSEGNTGHRVFQTQFGKSVQENYRAPDKEKIQRTFVIKTLFVTKDFAVKSNLLL